MLILSFKIPNAGSHGWSDAASFYPLAHVVSNILAYYDWAAETTSQNTHFVQSFHILISAWEWKCNIAHIAHLE